MSFATELPHAERTESQCLGRFSAWISAQLDRRRTIRSLTKCRECELQDVGITAQDIMNLTHNNGIDAVDEIRKNACMRSGNW